eukprot:TRINITY_DN884_c0_g1_i10.p1 TRINITY_DN884_c0_g1~~TRINITY_DN884_c0_g1_i10.p1  ORF type:complete len:809 (+),score=166.03 TRINITY_DN884_c0_g1_i10:202-2427(+)
MSGFHHRSTLTQKNKAFKSKHKTKGAVKASTSGKVNVRAGITSKNMVADGRLHRKNKAKQLRDKKTQAVRDTMRASRSIPLLVSLIPLSPTADLDAVRRALVDPTVKAPTRSGVPSPFADVSSGQVPNAPLVLHALDKNCHIQVLSSGRDIPSVLEAIKTSDVNIFVLRAGEELDLASNDIVDICRGQGAANPIGVVHNVFDIEGKASQVDIKKGALQFLKEQISTETRVFPIDTSDESFAFRRALTQTRLKPPVWRSSRGYVVTDLLNYTPTSPTHGTLDITGYVRGGHAISANRLIHLSNFGNFQIDSIHYTTDPTQAHRHAPKAGTGKGNNGSGMDTTADTASSSNAATTVAHVPDADRRDSLRSEGEPTFLENEQTWPTAEELEEADKRIAAENEGKKKRLPAGTSDYQAAWLEGLSDGEGEDGEGQGDEVPMLTDAKDVDMHEDGLTNEQREKAKRVELEARNKEDMEFPDEVDTPLDKAARYRFARYRGLKSFRNSEWDPKENLPVDYAHIFQFENVTATSKRVLADSEGVQPGQYVIIRVLNVPSEVVPKIVELRRPLIASGLLQYEKYKSVIHSRVQRSAAYEEPIKSKEKLILSIGFREFHVQPLFSEDSPNTDKKKFERFFRHGAFYNSTVIAPCHFGSAPVLLFKETAHMFTQKRTLVASGTYTGINPDLIITKRIILSGYPFKIHKRTATVRYMFFQPEDVHWFKPVEMWTKHGRVGHIKEALGTHGCK